MTELATWEIVVFGIIIISLAVYIPWLFREVKGK